MRTTLTLDDDVVAALERLRKSRQVSFKDLVNETLRRGLTEMKSRPSRRERFETKPVDMGRVLVGSIDNIGEVLAVAEGEAFK